MPLSVPSGPWTISTLTLEVPVRNSQTFSDQFSLNGKPVFKLDTALVTLFYPTSSSSSTAPPRRNVKDGISWLPMPRLKSMEGLVKYAGLSKYFAYPAIFVLPFSTKLPYTNDAPLSTQSPRLAPSDSPSAPASATSRSGRFPVGVFSHGLAGSRTTYSQYLAELASQGMIIASVEHRDGSGPSTTVQHSRDGKEETLTYFKHDELDKGEDGKEVGSVWEMRRAQLDLRQAEVLEVAHLLKRLDDGEGDSVAAASTRAVDDRANLQAWKGCLDLDHLWAIGHSFGGATSIELIRKPDSLFTHALVLDPWLEPIAKAGEGMEIKKPLFVINSEAFTIWRSHFSQLRQLVQQSFCTSGNAWLITVTKTAHTDFSDFGLLMPRYFKNSSGVSSQSLVSLFSQASQMGFLGSFDKSRLAFPVRNEGQDEVERRDLGKGGEVVWHPLDVAGSDSRL